MTRKKVLNGIIIFILLVFLLSTGLVSVMYFVDKGAATGTGESLSGDLIGTGINLSGSVLFGDTDTGEIAK